jgi:hypothetical protein
MTAAVPPNPLTTKIPTHAPTNFTTQRRTCQGMAPARRTSERRGQKINAPHDSTLQGNCSCRIRRRTATSEATFFLSLFHFPRFHHFTANVTQALPLEAIKGEAGATSRKRSKNETTRQQQLEHTAIETAHHHHWASLSELLVTSVTASSVDSEEDDGT